MFHADHSGAAVAFTDLASFGRGRSEMRRLNLPLFVALLALVPVVLPSSAEFLRNPAQLHRALRAGGARPCAADRRRWPDQFRAGRIRRCRCLHHCLADNSLWLESVVDAGHCLRRDNAGGAGARLHHAAHGRALPAARHDRLGISLYFLFGNIEAFGGHTGLWRHPAGEPVRNGAEERPRVLLPDLDRADARRGGDPEPARLTRWPRHPRAQAAAS